VLTLTWREEARYDVKQAIEYIAERNLGAADRLEAAILACADRISVHPYMYRPGRAPGTREAVVHPNYILIYRVGAAAVEIISLIHSRQQYP
jgi:plasmid stabilization system protein ParE